MFPRGGAVACEPKKDEEVMEGVAKGRGHDFEEFVRYAVRSRAFIVGEGRE